MGNIIEGLEGVAKSMDYFLIYGKTIGGHEGRIKKFLQRMKKDNVTLNPKRYLFRQKQVKSLGHLILAQELQPLSKKESYKEFFHPNKYHRDTTIFRDGYTNVIFQSFTINRCRATARFKGLKGLELFGIEYMKKTGD